jgi:undecaprenyl-diphosphatase
MRERLHRFIAARFSPEGELGLHFTCGAALMMLAAWLFGAVAAEMVEGDTLLVDTAVSRWCEAHHIGWVTTLMYVVTQWHSGSGILAMAAILGWRLWRRREHYWLLALSLAVPGGMALNVLLKHSFQRARPVFEKPLLELSTYSFPSGHTAGATLLYGFLAAYLLVRLAGWRARLLVLAAALAMVLLVGASRVYLGVHYPTDILAAICSGLAWLAVCITGVSTFRRRRALQGPA